LVELKVGLPVVEIFEQRGELAFRKLEHQTFLETLDREEPFILSLGGGTPCYFENAALLQSDNVVSFYLQASVSELARRIVGDITVRPVVQSIAQAELNEFIAKHLFERTHFYSQATYSVATDGLTAIEVAEKINAQLKYA
jgi:shikimate kinase